MDTKIINEEPFCFTVKQNTDDFYRIDTNWVNPKHKELNQLFEGLSKEKYNIVKLRQIASVKGGKRLPKGISHLYTDYDYNPYIRGASDLNNLRIKFSKCKKISDAIYNQVKGITLEDEDILISIAGTTAKLGFLKFDELNCKELDFNFNKIKFSENLAMIRAKDEVSVLPEYLLYYLNSHVGQFQLSRLTVGSNQGKISLKSLRNMSIPIPVNIEVQKDLIKNIKKYYKKIRENHHEEKKLIKSFDEILSNKFEIEIPEIDKVFSSYPSLEGDRIDSMYMNPSLESLINDIKSISHRQIGEIANVKKARHYEIPVMNYYGMIKIDDIDETIGEVKKIEDVNISDIPSKKLLIQEGNVYISRINPDLGNVFYANNELGGCITSPEMRALEITEEEVLSKYLWLMCRSPFVIRQWECQISESSRRRIKKKVIENTFIPWINKKEQMDLIKKCEELNTKIKKKRLKAKELEKKARGILTKRIFDVETIESL